MKRPIAILFLVMIAGYMAHAIIGHQHGGHSRALLLGALVVDADGDGADGHGHDGQDAHTCHLFCHDGCALPPIPTPPCPPCPDAPLESPTQILMKDRILARETTPEKAPPRIMRSQLSA